jgi:hypothetical protein
MNDMNQDFFEEDEPAEKIFEIFDGNPDKGVTGAPLPFGGQLVEPVKTSGTARVSTRANHGVAASLGIQGEQLAGV